MDLTSLLHDAVDTAHGPPVDPVPALRRRRTAAGAVRTDVAVLAAP